jgi:hypothetical protein
MNGGTGCPSIHSTAVSISYYIGKKNYQGMMRL